MPADDQLTCNVAKKESFYLLILPEQFKTTLI